MEVKFVFFSYLVTDGQLALQTSRSINVQFSFTCPVYSCSVKRDSPLTTGEYWTCTLAGLSTQWTRISVSGLYLPRSTSFKVSVNVLPANMTKIFSVSTTDGREYRAIVNDDFSQNSSKIPVIIEHHVL